MYHDDNDISPDSENRFIRVSAIGLVLVIALICVSDIQTTLLVMRTGWDGSAGSILSPQEAKVFYTCCSIADGLLLLMAVFFLLRSRQKMVLFTFAIFVLTQAAAGIIKYTLTDGREHQMERNHISPG
ncbi:MAG: hypothetical protein JNM41_01800 [Flavipsychrobacter sp.]|nr:hypothetical protein [Flavipsychrobacter sp.]